MRPFGPTTIVDERPSHNRDPRPRSLPVRIAGTAVAALVLALGALSDPTCTNGADALPQASSNTQVPPAGDSVGLLADARAQLQRLQAQILALGARVLARADAANRMRVEDLIVNEQITVKSAESNYENARLTREVAEIGVVEYTEGIYKQDQATLEMDRILAQSEFERAGDVTAFVRDRLDKTRTASKGSAPDLAYEYSLEDQIVKLGLRETRTRLALENAQSKLDFFRQYAKPKHVKELQSEVEKARAGELAAQARWEREKFKLRKLQAASKRQDREVHQQRVMTLMAEAVSVAEQLKSKLDQAANDRQPGQALRKEIADMTNELQALVEKSQCEDAAAQWAKVKPRVRGAAVRFLDAQAK